MPNLPLTNTEQTAKSAFRPHGLVEYKARGQILDSIARGPFNDELMKALFELAKATFPAMTEGGSWANIAVFQVSALCSPEILGNLTEALRQLATMGVTPTTTAYVLAEGVEGTSFMGPLYAKCYRDAGLDFASFKQLSDAEDWVNAKLHNAKSGA